MRWYDVCDDYSLETRTDKPDLSDLESMEIEGGTAYGFDLDGEGPVFFVSSDDDLDGCYLGGWE